MSSDALLRAGLAPVDGDAGQPVSARTYHHPALAEPVVRLTGDRVALAEDRTMEFLGYGEPEVSEPLARSALQGLNYPTWALVHDPENAALALSTLKELEQAAKKAITSPNAALAVFTSVAERLPRTHLPSFWEQAGRLFLGAERAHYAGRMFSKAREVELTYALPVDESLRQAVFIEFALAGAVTVKALTAYLSELKSRYTPDEAFAAFEKVVLGRIRGGQPPWTTLVEQWRGLAVDAGRDPDAEVRRLLASILDAPSMRSAPGRFWTMARKEIVALGQSDPAHREALLWLFPKKNSYDTDEQLVFLGEWLELLDEAGALRQLVESGDTSRWLHRVLDVMRERRCWHVAPPRLLVDLLPKLARTCGPIDLSESGSGWSQRYINVDVLAELLRLGVPVSGPPDGVDIGLGDWVKHGTADIVSLQGDARWRRVLHAALDEAAGSGLVRHERLAPVLGEWLTAQAEDALAGGVADLERVMPVFDAVDLRRYPEAFAGVERIDLAETLRRTLRAGLVEEMAWPAYEEAMGELEADRKGNVWMSHAWPTLTLYNRRKAIAVGPQGRIAEHIMQWPAGQKRDAVVLFLDGQFMVCWSVTYNEAYTYWSGDPGRILTDKSYWLASQHADFGYHLVTNDGARIGHDAMLRPGDIRANTGCDYFSDGQSYWRCWGSQGLVLIDPNTGSATGTPVATTDLPAFFASSAPDGHTDRFQSSSLAPLPDGDGSPLGFADGLVGTRVSADGETIRVERIDGRAVTVPRRNQGSPWALVTLPARADAPLVVDGANSAVLVDADGRRHGISTIRTTAVPPPAYWHFLVARDEALSVTLRDLDSAGAARLLEASAADVEAETPGEAAVTSNIDVVLDDLGVAAGPLRAAIVRLARSVVDFARRRTALLAEPTASSFSTGPVIDHSALGEALWGVTMRSSYRRECSMGDELLVIDDFLHRRIDAHAALARHDASGYELKDVIEGLPMIAVRASSPCFPEAERAAASTLLSIFAVSIVLSGDIQVASMHRDDLYFQSDDHGVLYSVGKTWKNGRYMVDMLVLGEPKVPFEMSTTPLALSGMTSETVAAMVSTLENGPVAITDEAIEALTDRTGLPRAASALLLAGMPRQASYVKDFLGAEARAELRLSIAEAQNGKVWLAGMEATQLSDLYRAALMAVPEALHDINARARSLADVWMERFGTIPRIDDAAITPAGDIVGTYHVRNALLLLTDPAGQPSTHLTSQNGIMTFRRLLHWAVMTLPEGHPLRANLAAVIARVRQDVGSQNLVRMVGRVDSSAVPEEFVSGTPVRVDGLDEKAHDLGALLLVPDAYGFTAYVRFDRLVGDPHESLIHTFDHGGDLEHRAWLFGDDPDALAARVGAIPDGRYDTDPTASVPDLVAEVASTLDVDADAAALYLQLLALPNPTDKNVRLWNAWKPKRHKAAVAVLVERGLVVEAKRMRAGRSVFLPGGWEAKTSPHPYETWKIDMYQHFDGVFQHAPCPQLFATAWERVTSGEGPR